MITYNSADSVGTAIRNYFGKTDVNELRSDLLPHAPHTRMTEVCHASTQTPSNQGSFKGIRDRDPQFERLRVLTLYDPSREGVFGC